MEVLKLLEIFGDNYRNNLICRLYLKDFVWTLKENFLRSFVNYKDCSLGNSLELRWNKNESKNIENEEDSPELSKKQHFILPFII